MDFYVAFRLPRSELRVGRAPSAESEMAMAVNVVILGATGSIGTSTLDVIRHLNGRFRAAAVTAYGNWEKLADIALEFNPDIDDKYFTTRYLERE